METNAILGYRAVKRLAVERPDWLPIVKICLEEHKRTNGDFAGSWVLNKAKEKGIKDWLPNLRILVSYEILQKEGVSRRGGRRAYYSITDPKGVEEALGEIKK